jgi:hypothetical protein
MVRMTQEERNDKTVLLYLKEKNISEIEQVSKKDRAVIFNIFDR